MKTGKKTKEQVIKELQERFPNLQLIGDYVGANEKMLIKCTNCGHEWYAIPRSVKASKHGCVKCGHLKANYEKSLQYFLNKYDSNQNELIEFESCHKVVVKCKKCGYIRTTTADNIYRYGCPACGQIKTHESQKLSKEEFIERAVKVHGNSYDYSKIEYVNYNTKVCIVCPKHGEFWQEPRKHLVDKCGCPKCSSSHGEKLICAILNELKIQYQHQVRINNPYADNNFIVDFKINDLIIEYNGIQHYVPVEHFGGELKFQKQKQRDQHLRQYCQDNNLKLLEIPFNDNESDIRNKIYNILNILPPN